MEEETQEKTKKINFNATIIIVAIIFAISYIYVENSKIAYQEKLRTEKELKQKEQQEKLEECLEEAANSSDNLWNANCKYSGKKNNCDLDLEIAEHLNKIYEKNRKECIEKFKTDAF